jgi:hypothetical protein
MRDLINALGRVFDMERVGGQARVYNVGDRKGVIFLLNNSLRAIGLVWSKGTTSVQSVGVWNKINFDGSPDFMVDIPAKATLDQVIEPLIQFIRHPREGMVESIELTETARNVSPSEFRDMARQLFKDKSNYMTLDDLKKVADHFAVHIPSAIRHDRGLRVDANHWNLHDDETAEIAKAIGAKVGVPDPNDKNFQTAVELAKVKNLRDMASQGKVVLLGRKASGEIFEIPGVDAITAEIERKLEKELESGVSSISSMEEQYRQLEQKVKLIASGESEFVKSLLITGMPSAGKTFRVMQTIKSMGLKEGEDYSVVGGKTTVKATYRVLIEQVNGLAIFDDCDSVVEDKNGKNMMKKALDTDPIREVSYNASGLLNTGAMSREERNAIVNSMSRILRGVPAREDLYLFDSYRKLPQRTSTKHTRDTWVAQIPKEFQPTTDDEWKAVDRYIKDHNDMEDQVGKDELIEMQDWVLEHMPNKIDFQGRIIFISNMGAEQWDSAILTRAMHQDMQFSDAEMFDYIRTILTHIKTPRLTEEDKVEVLDYLKELWEEGKITRPVNFRLVQQAFDLRLMNGWRELVANIG